jgi:uncharacterized protein YbaP (TraB family)
VVNGLCLLLFVIVAAPAGEAAVFRCTDVAGKSTLHDRPCGMVEVTQGDGARNDSGAAESGRHLMWTATGARGTAYMVGSLHFGKPEMFPLPAVMTRAYEDSQALVVETDLTALDPAQMARIVAAKAMYSDATKLSLVLAPESWKELNRVMGTFGASAQSLERQKPWFVSVTLTSLALRRFGFDEELGIDNHFMKLAYRKKPILELETFQQQLDFLDGFSAAEQEEMLKETFQDIDKGRAFLADTLQAWQAGDARKIDELLNEDFRISSATDRHMYQVLIADRNAAMADKLDRLLQRGGRYFVVLGAAHFVGKDGIVELLKARSYQVRQD